MKLRKSIFRTVVASAFLASMCVTALGQAKVEIAQHLGAGPVSQPHPVELDDRTRQTPLPFPLCWCGTAQAALPRLEHCCLSRLTAVGAMRE